MSAVAISAGGGSSREVAAFVEQAYAAYTRVGDDALSLSLSSRKRLLLQTRSAVSFFVQAGCSRFALRSTLFGHRLLFVVGGSHQKSSLNELGALLPLQQVLQLPAAVVGGAGVSNRFFFDAASAGARRLLTANSELPALDAQAWQTQVAEVQSRLEKKAFLSEGVSPQQLQTQLQTQLQHQMQIHAQSQAIRSAVLLEQAAMCYQRARNGCRRKRDFQLVMAGHTYYKAGEAQINQVSPFSLTGFLVTLGFSLLPWLAARLSSRHF